MQGFQRAPLHCHLGGVVIENQILPQFQGTDPRVREAILVIQTGGPCRISGIASRLNLSASRLRHLFKKEIGTSLAHYIQTGATEAS